MADELKKTASAKDSAPLGTAAASASSSLLDGGGDAGELGDVHEFDGGICNCCGSPCTCCPGWGICGLVFCSFGSCLFG